MKVVTESGFHDGVFRRAGAVVPAATDEAVDLGAMSKAELLAEAARRGVEVKESDTKAEIIAALGG